MFRGRFDHAIDMKGRVSIPAGFRMELQRRSEKAPIVTIWWGCLALFAHDDWAAFEELLTDVDPFRMEGHALQRFWISNCVECPPDAQGRILIPPYLREHAKLDKEVTIAGAGRRIEIWDRKLYGEDIDGTLRRLPEISSEVSKLGR